MKVCVYGAGAVGGQIAGRLADGGAEVTIIERGEQLDAIREHGLQVQTHDRLLVSQPAVTDRPGDLESQDVVIVAVKAPVLPKIAADVASVLHENSLVLFVGNGIPWWYFHAHGGPLDGTQLRRLDPDGTLRRHIGPQRAVGVVAYTAGSVPAPGIVQAPNPRNRLILGRPDGQPDPRLDTVASLLTAGGFETSITPRIRDAVWAKLVMNLIGGSLAVLTVSPMKDVLDKPSLARAAEAMGDEAAAIAAALGCDLGAPREGLTKLASSGHLQSIAQDLQAGRPPEIDAMFRVPLDLAALAEVPAPTLQLVIDLATQRARAAGLYTDTSS